MSLLKWAIVVGILAVVAGVLGFAGIAGALADIAKVLFFVFLAGVIILVVAGAWLYKKVT